MLNDGTNNVPDNTIVAFSDNLDFDINLIEHLITKPDKRRQWFNPEFYHCSPLVLGNQQGFMIRAPFDFAFEWDGGDGPESLKLWTDAPHHNRFDPIHSSFGKGVLSINPPYVLRTPPGVNLITINPPNFIIPNVTVMTGTVETDNLRRNFTLNLKIHLPNIKVQVAAGDPIGCILPVPRGFADGFTLKKDYEVFKEDVILEEMNASLDAGNHRSEMEPNMPNQVSRHYFEGRDVYGNYFSNHQKP